MSRTVAQPPARPVLLYDGDCRFCRVSVSRWRRWMGDRVDVVPLAECPFGELSREDLERAMHLVLPDGRVLEGAAALVEAMRTCGHARPLVALHDRSALVRGLAARTYAVTARHRAALSKLVWLGHGRSFEAPSFDLAGALFFRLFGLIYVCAFVSLWIQIDGLAGSRGILPAADLMRAAAEQHVGFLQLPTLCHWLGAGDATLRGLCAAGAGAGLLMAAGFLPPFSAAAAWLLYLSLCSVVRTFLNFQWDAMLLETGFLAIFLVPPALWLRPGSTRILSRFARWLLVWLLFRLMFAAGVVKLASRDPAWWDLSALTYHYWSQCLPPWTAWYFDKLPLWAHQASCLVMFVIELAVPFCVFGPRRLRHFAATCFLLLMAVILASGNYGFFDLLACVLCVLLIDDAAWRRLFRRRDQPLPGDSASARWFRRAALPVLALVFLLTWLPFTSAVVGAQSISGVIQPWEPPRPAWLEQLYGRVAPFRSINGYGLFAVMTKQRDEIILEGTDDGVTWRAYEFRWKPGDVMRRPRFCVPHMPRLDWQMWFASLGEIRGNPWLVNTMVRLLEGEPAVTGLLAHNPFPDRPPRAIRAVAYGYRFTSTEERRATGAWWKRDAGPRPYCPPLQLQR